MGSNNTTNTTSISTNTTNIVIIEWDDLINDEPNHNNENTNTTTTSTKIVSSIIEQAYGTCHKDSIGILVIRGVPGFVEAKQRLLRMGYNLAVTVPEDYRENHLTDPSSLYNAGWSFGKEKLGLSKPPDIAKGSYYYNPITDTPGTIEDRTNYPLSYPCNKWPDETFYLPGFQVAAKEIGCILHHVVRTVAKHIDYYVATKLNQNNNNNDDVTESSSSVCYPPNFLYNQLKDTEKVKGRLLYYYPLQEKKQQCNYNDDDGNNNDGTNVPSSDNNANDNDDPKQQPNHQQQDDVVEDSWIGWHNDSGFLTALAGDIYVDHTNGNVIPCPDNDAGLYVIKQDESIVHISIPDDCCAVQIGECTQIITGGIVRATPHCVRGPQKISTTTATTPSDITTPIHHVARISLPCFVDTPPTFQLQPPPTCSRETILDASINTTKVPPLAQRWKSNQQTFGDFLQTTFSLYYEW